jgi:hypothetical protein
LESYRLSLISSCALVALFATASVFGQYHPAPTGGIRLVWDVEKWDYQIARAKQAGGVTEEEYFRGYPLSKDPDVRRKQMSLHSAAVKHEEHVLRVLRVSGDGRQRALAATALGYSRHSPTQVGALVYATSDPDATVREAATKALRAIAIGHPKSRDKIPSRVLD